MLLYRRQPSLSLIVLVATAVWLAVSMSVSKPLLAQERGALEVLRSLPLDSLDGTIRVYHSPGHTERAAALQRMYESALSFYRDTLNHPFQATLAVLTEEHWAALVWGPPYGMPWVTYRAPDPVVVLPATTDRGVVADRLRHLQLGDEEVRRGVESIGFHEFGHGLVQQYLYPGELRVPPVRWFDEMMATYMGQGYVWMSAPATLAQLRQQQARMLAAPRPRMTSLPDFEANYWDLASSPNAANYQWYQTQLSIWASEIFAAQGLEFVLRLKERLPWEHFDHWTSEELLLWLDAIEPGFSACAASLES
jgi:hypothetical protein